MTTLGEDRVHIEHNPTDSFLVAEIKHKTAELIDLCNSNFLRRGANANTIRCGSIAITHLEDACRWAVTAAMNAKR